MDNGYRPVSSTAGASVTGVATSAGGVVAAAVCVPASENSESRFAAHETVAAMYDADLANALVCR
jgi:hypothetical protein